MFSYYLDVFGNFVFIYYVMTDLYRFEPLIPQDLSKYPIIF